MKLDNLLSILNERTSSVVLSPAISGADGPLELRASSSLNISGLSLDSRDVLPGHIFFAVFGTYTDGHSFIGDALDKGASVIIAERETEHCERCREAGIPYFITTQIRELIAQLAAEFYEHPSLSVHTVAVTGTNGKTSVAWLLSSMFRELSGKAGLIGTLGTGILKQGEAPQFGDLATTTPNPIELHEALAEVRDSGTQYAAIEATSQGLVQNRTKDVHWDGAIFTNLTRDHLDLHQTMERYKECKKILFSKELLRSQKANKVAVFNIDDATGCEFRDSLLEENQPNLKVVTFSIKQSEAYASLIESKPSLRGTTLRVRLGDEEATLVTKLVGEYNVSNVVAAACYLHAAGFKVSDIETAVKTVTTVPGRLERVAESDVHVFVDYAHTPDALENVQDSLLPLCEKRLITVFGCGGDRDRGKRPLMGAAVSARSHVAIATSDNPRTEDPERIIKDIVPGLVSGAEQNSCEYETVTNRKDAIQRAIEIAEPGDVVLVAGKGHEPYQEVHGVRHQFDDRDVCREVMREAGLA